MHSNRPFRSYGLIKKNEDKTLLKTSVFDEPDDTEEQCTSKCKSSFEGGKIKKETKQRIEKALIEDPSIFEYDSVYDDFKSEKKSEPKVQTARYLPTLLKTAENRKKEQERRLERKIQKEREAEGDEFADKDAFVTTAYKEKLIEMQIEIEKDNKEKQIEELLDVRKQKDLSGFYRNLLDQHTTETSTEITEKPTFTSKKVNRNLRSRNRSSSESSGNSPTRLASEEKFEKLERSSERAVKTHKKRNETKEERNDKEQNKNQETNSVSENQTQKEENLQPVVDNKEFLISLFKKRTVGEVFDEKRRQYLLRKQSRIQN